MIMLKGAKILFFTKNESDIIQNFINEEHNILDIINKNIIKEIYKNMSEGYIYCLYNSMFDLYGKNIYKLGCTNNIKKRISMYVTSYIDNPIIKHQSNKLKYYEDAERILFLLLKQYRIKQSREFFQCDLLFITKIISEVETIVNFSDPEIFVLEYDTLSQKNRSFIKKFYMILSKDKLFSNIVLKYNNSIRQKEMLNAKNINSITQKEILSAKNINSPNFEILYKKLILSNEEKILIEKYLYLKYWKINEITEDFMEKFYGKTYILYNLRWLINSSKIEPYIYVENKASTKFDQIEILEKIRVIKQLLNKLGYENVQDIKKIERKQFKENMKMVLSECELFINPKKCEPLFGFKKGKIESVKSFLGFINHILKDWGVQIKLCRTISSKILNKIKKTISKDYYHLNFIDKINNYL